MLAENLKFYKVLVSLFHPLQIETTCRVLHMLGGKDGYCWHSE